METPGNKHIAATPKRLEIGSALLHRLYQLIIHPQINIVLYYITLYCIILHFIPLFVLS